MSGFSKRVKGAEKIGNKELGAYVLWLINGKGNLIFISIDTLYIPIEVSEPIYEYLWNNNNIIRDNIIFNATHTHSAPAIDEVFDSRKADQIYRTEMIDKIKSFFINQSDHCFSDCHICYKSILISNNLFVSRRRAGRNIKSLFLSKKILMLPNEENVIDNNLKTFYLTDMNNKLKLLVYNLSCHPVFNRSNNISSDYIGEINRIIKIKTGVDSLFLQGFSGDVRPNFTTNNIFSASIVNKLKIIFNGRVFKPLKKKDFNYFCISIADDILNNICLLDKEMISQYEIRSNQNMYLLTSESGKTTNQFIAKFIKFDKNLFISIPAEVTSKYYVELSKKFPQYNLIPLGVADGIIGYLPHYSEVNAGGYEVDFAFNYGWDANISFLSLKEFYLKLCEDLTSFLEEDDVFKE
ncbi:MAG: hypothetical protein GY870_06165 [archaeon]|nr:hypothetical protein [archaeon]